MVGREDGEAHRLRGFIGGSSYTALVITTTGIAVTQPFIINAFGMISALWFPPAERGNANGWGLICLLAVNGIFKGNHMGTLIFFLVGTVLSLVLTAMIKEASLKERRIE